MVHGGVFINYRGEDSRGYGPWLRAELSQRFGSELVFLDSTSIPAGADFVAQLLGRVRQAAVVLAVIGRRWLTAAGPDGRRRIDDPADWIRRELVAAFEAGVRVIPVLTDGAEMPTEADLPADLAPLARCQYRWLRHGDAAGDPARLVADLAELDPGLGAAARKASPSPMPASSPLASSPVGWPVAVWPMPNQLPAAARYFTGRDAELARLLRLPDEARTLVVSAVDGMAGIGKTALVVLAAHRLIEAGRYPDGTLFVDLHGYSGRGPTDPADALKTLLEGLGVPGPQIPAETDARIGLYRSALTGRQVLIVLDNVRDEGQVRPLLPGTGGSLVLITSRQRLSGLDEADHLNLGTMPAHEAGWLFQAVAGPDRDPGDQETIEQIVKLCGYLPLAIRIAGARLRTDRAGALTGAGLLAQLQTEQQTDRLAALTAGDRSIAAAFAISYRYLPAAQQDAFVALGAHPGVEFEPHATAALLDTTPTQAGHLLCGLEHVNLLDQPTPGRHRFHDLIRAYATTLADARPEADRHAALDRLLDHYAHTTTHAVTLAYPYDAARLPRPPHVATATPHLPDQIAALTWLDTELPNLLAAANATAHRPGHIIHQSATLHRHLRFRGHCTDAGTLHENALTAAQATGDMAAQVTALNNLGRAHYMQDRYGPTTDCYTQALDLARGTGNRAGEVDALNGLGRVHYLEGRYGPATECLTQALEIARATGNRTGELNALTGIGRVHHARGRYGPATECLTQALEIARATGNRAGELTSLDRLGRVHYARGRYGPAADCYTEASGIARDTGNRTGELTTLNDLGRVHHARGRYGPAADCYARALAMARATGSRTGELNALTGLGHVDFAQGNPGPAAKYFGQVLDLAHEIGSIYFQVQGHLGLGHTQHTTGHAARALATYQQALDLARDLDRPAEQARAHNGLARAHDTLGHPDQARHHWQQALNILTTLDTPAADELTTTDLHAHLAPRHPNPEPSP